MNHMIYVGYNVAFANTFLFEEEEGDSQSPQVLPIERNQEDIETVVSTTEQHRQHGKVVNERSTWSPNVSQKSGPSKKELNLQLKRKINPQLTTLMMEVTITLLREVLKNPISFQ
jgi:hypothetical protein